MTKDPMILTRKDDQFVLFPLSKIQHLLPRLDEKGSLSSLEVVFSGKGASDLCHSDEKRLANGVVYRGDDAKRALAVILQEVTLHGVEGDASELLGAFQEEVERDTVPVTVDLGKGQEEKSRTLANASHSEGVTYLDIWYPRSSGEHTLQVGLMDVRAVGDIRITFDFEKNGYVIWKEANVAKTEEHLEWVPVAFVEM